MNGKLLDENEKVDFKKLEKIMNEEIKDDIKNNEEDVNTEKWSMFPVLYLEKKAVTEQVKNFVRYIDRLDMTRLKKISLILTLVYLMEKCQLSIEKMDINSLYLITSYLENKSDSSIVESLAKVNNSDLLYQVRCSSLDLNVRSKMLDYVIKNNFNTNDVINLVVKNDYYKLLDIIK